ncbi:hypothetical protein C2845_PM09G04790 [Panicum miliaceum]|uniref:Uncharacterized protein n=1 Tax=Panicum miliaceum TaxID=4540 RepID=A0A3L6RZX3_PANMI|nr:hypothetical protein C2845_PM09G04790 [Panicum miliaceum]
MTAGAAQGGVQVRDAEGCSSRRRAGEARAGAVAAAARGPGRALVALGSCSGACSRELHRGYGDRDLAGPPGGVYTRHPHPRPPMSSVEKVGGGPDT